MIRRELIFNELRRHVLPPTTGLSLLQSSERALKTTRRCQPCTQQSYWLGSRAEPSPSVSRRAYRIAGSQSSLSSASQAGTGCRRQLSFVSEKIGKRWDRIDRRKYSQESGSHHRPTLMKHNTAKSIQSRANIPQPCEELREAAARGDRRSVSTLVSRMMRVSDEPLNLKLYAALVLVNIDQDSGCAAEVARLFQEMAEAGIHTDSSIQHDALKVLAVHPDALLRGQIVEEMRKHWYNLSADGSHDVVAGLLREGQLELALEGIDEMRRTSVDIQPWLYDMALYMLCDTLELDEAFDLMQRRLEDPQNTVGGTSWFYLFDVACEVLHIEVIRFVWYRRVQTVYLNPTTGQCFQVLNAAARDGDIKLANAVFAKLRERGTDLESIHYELLMQAYEHNGELEAILSITAIMEEAGIRLSPRALEALSNCLAQSPSRCKDAIGLLGKISTERKVPTATFNCLIESSVTRGNHEAAIDLYKQLQLICVDGADVNTFNALFRSCRRKGGKAEAMFFAAEMVALKIRPNPLTYDRLLLVCLEEGDLEDAFQYYNEMRESGFQPRVGTWIAMIKKFAEENDERTLGLASAMKELGLDPELAARHLQENDREKVAARKAEA